MGNLKAVARDPSTGRVLKIVMPSKNILEKLYLEECDTPWKIGEKYHASSTTVHRWLQECGIPLKRPYLSNVKMNITSVEKAYFAGYLDGDGTITIGFSSNKRSHRSINAHAEVALITKHKDFAEKMIKIIGGNLQTFLYHDSREKKSCYKVSFGNQRSALAFLEQIEPFLMLKQPQAKLMITYLRQRLRARENGNGAIVSEESWKIISELRKLNDGNKGYTQKYKV